MITRYQPVQPVELTGVTYVPGIAFVTCKIAHPLQIAPPPHMSTFGDVFFVSFFDRHFYHRGYVEHHTPYGGTGARLLLHPPSEVGLKSVSNS